MEDDRRAPGAAAPLSSGEMAQARWAQFEALMAADAASSRAAPSPEQVGLRARTEEPTGHAPRRDRARLPASLRAAARPTGPRGSRSGADLRCWRHRAEGALAAAAILALAMAGFSLVSGVASGAEDVTATAEQRTFARASEQDYLALEELIKAALSEPEASRGEVETRSVAADALLPVRLDGDGAPMGTGFGGASHLETMRTLEALTHLPGGPA
ncbi:hypothetical protein [Rubrimonas cliftonensis]|nr:hypothetical protein [Rubrimonas cliftonensis]